MISIEGHHEGRLTTFRKSSMESQSSQSSDRYGHTQKSSSCDSRAGLYTCSYIFRLRRSPCQSQSETGLSMHRIQDRYKMIPLRKGSWGACIPHPILKCFGQIEFFASLPGFRLKGDRPLGDYRSGSGAGGAAHHPATAHIRCASSSSRFHAAER